MAHGNCQARRTHDALRADWEGFPIQKARLDPRPCCATVGSLRCRATMVAMMGLFTWLAISISQWTWYRFPFSFIALDAIDQVIGWLLPGFLMAKMIKPAQPQPIGNP